MFEKFYFQHFYCSVFESYQDLKSTIANYNEPLEGALSIASSMYIALRVATDIDNPDSMDWKNLLASIND